VKEERGPTGSGSKERRGVPAQSRASWAGSYAARWAEAGVASRPGRGLGWLGFFPLFFLFSFSKSIFTN